MQNIYKEFAEIFPLFLIRKLVKEVKEVNVSPKERICFPESILYKSFPNQIKII